MNKRTLVSLVVGIMISTQLYAETDPFEFKPDLEGVRTFYRYSKERYGVDYTEYGRWDYNFIVSDQTALNELTSRLEKEGWKVEINPLEDSSQMVTVIIMASQTAEDHYEHLVHFIALVRGIPGAIFGNAGLPR